VRGSKDFLRGETSGEALVKDIVEMKVSLLLPSGWGAQRQEEEPFGSHPATQRSSFSMPVGRSISRWPLLAANPKTSAQTAHMRVIEKSVILVVHV